jgi:hypothetical protein
MGLITKFGDHRDGQEGKKMIVYGLLVNSQGRPISIQAYPGNTILKRFLIKLQKSAINLVLILLRLSEIAEC